MSSVKGWAMRHFSFFKGNHAEDFIPIKFFSFTFQLASIVLPKRAVMLN